MKQAGTGRQIQHYLTMWNLHQNAQRLPRLAEVRRLGETVQSKVDWGIKFGEIHCRTQRLQWMHCVL